LLSFGDAAPRRVIASPGHTDPFSKTQLPPTGSTSRRALWFALGIFGAAAIGVGIAWAWHRTHMPVIAAKQQPVPAPVPVPVPVPVAPPPVVAAPQQNPVPVAAPQQPPPVAPAKHAKHHAPSHPTDEKEPKDQKLPGGVVDQVPF
jgi:hypothetical protein